MADNPGHSVESRCVGCGQPFDPCDLMFRQPDGTWRITCSRCGNRQQRSAISGVVRDGR